MCTILEGSVGKEKGKMASKKTDRKVEKTCRKTAARLAGKMKGRRKKNEEGRRKEGWFLKILSFKPLSTHSTNPSGK